MTAVLTGVVVYHPEPEPEVEAERVIVAYTTQNSVYEVDHTGPGFRVRRVTGNVAPTIYTGQDGVWQDADRIRVTPFGGLLIEWSHGGSTQTSTVVATDPVSPAPAEGWHTPNPDGTRPDALELDAPA